MFEVDRHRLLVDGAASDGREPVALSPGYFQPQERRLEHFLVLLSATAAETPFVTPDGRLDADGWKKIFGDDPLFAYAQLLAIDVQDRTATFNDLIETNPNAALTALAKTAKTLANLRRSLNNAAERRTADTFDSLGGVGLDATAEHWLNQLASAEPAARLNVVLALEDVPNGDNPINAARGAKRALRQAHDRMLNIVEGVRESARTAFETLLNSGTLNPALGLAMAKIEALRSVTDRMNDFTERHTDFYYRDVLGQAPMVGKPDRTFLTVTPGSRAITVKRKARISARTEAGDLRTYRLLDDLRAAPIQVGEAHVLRYRRDPHMRPQGGMGFVTSVSAVKVDKFQDEETAPYRLFGARRGQDVEMGVRITSPMFWLAEGRRRITVQTNLTPRGPSADSDAGVNGDIVQTLFSDPRLMRTFGLEADPATAEAIESAAAEARALSPSGTPLSHLLHGLLLLGPDAPTDAVRAVYGRAVAAALIEGQPWPESGFRSELLATLHRHAPETEVVKNAERLFDTDRADRFQEILGEAFQVRLSTANGWHDVEALRVSATPKNDPPGLRFTIVLDEGVPSIAPLSEADTPEISIMFAPNARFSALSILEPFLLESVEIAVQVQGLKRLTAFSETGLLDTAQPFQPFGPQPSAGAVFMVGATELARKSVRRVAATIEWADAPEGGDGFTEMYEGYGTDFTPPDPKLDLAYLTADGWKRLTDRPSKMFEQRPTTRAFETETRLEAAIPGEAEPPGFGFDVNAFRRRQDVRAGLLRISLVGDNDLFGHAAYPPALARAMRPSFLPFYSRKTPKPPFTPKIASIRLDYAARTRIVLSAADSRNNGARITQIGPFGEIEIYPLQERAATAGLAAERLSDGAFFFRLQGEELSGSISLLFEMSDGAHRRRAFPPAPINIKYLTSLGWADLPLERIVSDTTDRLMRSGVVSLVLPDDAELDAPEMPGRGIWMAVCADERLDDFPRLISLKINAVIAEHDPAEAITDDMARSLDGSGTALSRVAFDPPVRGIVAVNQAGRTFGGATAETAREFRTRIAERLRHRGRAVTAWDVERLVLKAFPEVLKAKCLPAYASTLANSGPAGLEVGGAIIVVVVPHPPIDAWDRPSQARTFDTLTLRRIEAMLRGVVSPFAEIEVRNPSFERLQIRGELTFISDVDGGALAQRLKLDVSRYLSVWDRRPPLSGFGWSVHMSDVGGFVLSRPYVRSIDAFSIVQLVQRDGGAYRLYDTVRTHGRSTLLPAEPWSLPLPMPEQWIQTHPTKTVVGSAPPRPAGVGGLRVGQNLVVAEKAVS